MTFVFLDLPLFVSQCNVINSENQITIITRYNKTDLVKYMSVHIYMRERENINEGWIGTGLDG